MAHPDRLTDLTGLTVTYDNLDGVWRLHSKEHSMIVAISGSVKRGPTSSLYRSALAVYFGQDSTRNIFTFIPDETVQEQEAADLYTAMMALEIIQSSSLATDLKLLVVKTSSSFIPAAMSKRCWALEDGTKQRSTSKRSVKRARFDGWMIELHEVCKELEAAGVEVQFWQVGRKLNIVARNLSKASLK
ncbi:uncharacterized protein RAG0_15803 [Rhynchosporium agropyri]|uniref:RNase H type-1 domain-containing protein n=1 Tax=Rhynchosporium agropyri TaxID=914238 RepID=A0A1E1LMJ8_9HELO|nr:uncharacterized protein RAG0_15803 [Rhynchosporium agropyri]